MGAVVWFGWNQNSLTIGMCTHNPHTHGPSGVGGAGNNEYALGLAAVEGIKSTTFPSSKWI